MEKKPLVRNGMLSWEPTSPKYHLLTEDEEKALSIRIQMGDNLAREQLINSNLGLVFSIANQFTNHIRHTSGLSMEDLVQEGNIGLILATEKYNPERGKFSTCAALWIKQQIWKTLKQHTGSVRLPARVSAAMLKYNKVVDELTGRYSRPPTNQEIAEFMGKTSKELYKIQNLMRNVTSMNAADSTIKGEEEYDQIGKLTDTKNPPVAEATERKLVFEEMVTQIDTMLEGNEREVIHERMGINEDNNPHTLESVAESIGRSPENVRQIEKRVIQKLRKLNFCGFGKKGISNDGKEKLC
jgi:RNA polymerase sigma factor (sigma-70 family)